MKNTYRPLVHWFLAQVEIPTINFSRPRSKPADFDLVKIAQNIAQYAFSPPEVYRPLKRSLLFLI
jgi:hypothetical protein